MPRSGPEYSEDLRQGVDYFEVLGVDETASAEDVVTAFRAKIKAVHPDLNGGKHDPDTVSRIARARKTLTGADREAYLKARAAKRETASRPAGVAPESTRPPDPAASDDVWDGPEARAWKRAAEEVRRRAEAEHRSRRAAERSATMPPRAARPVSPGASPGPGSRTTSGPASWPRAGDESRRPSSPPGRSESPFLRPTSRGPSSRPFEPAPRVPPTVGRPPPMSTREAPRSADEILRGVQRRSAEILDQARWRSDDQLAETQRRSREVLDDARARKSFVGRGSDRGSRAGDRAASLAETGRKAQRR